MPFELIVALHVSCWAADGEIKVVGRQRLTYPTAPVMICSPHSSLQAEDWVVPAERNIIERNLRQEAISAFPLSCCGVDDEIQVVG